MLKKEIEKTDYFCILAGGGVRGTAYVGVFRALEELNIKVKGVAGSSVGSIFSALYAVGHSPEEMHEAIFAWDFETITDIYVPFGKDFGICKGDNIFRWIKNTLEKKYYGAQYVENHNKPIKFSDIDTDLIIIATDIASSQIKEFSRYSTPDIEIAQAIRASISIPGFFRPVWDEEGCYVDGDIIKNLPLWVSSKSITNNHNRILEFRLEADSTKRKISNPIDFFNSVIDTASNVSTEFIIDLYAQNDRFDYIKINTGDTKIVDFSIADERKRELVKIGYDTTMLAFTNQLLQKRKEHVKVYENLQKQLILIRKYIDRKQIQKAKLTLSDLVVIIINHASLDKEVIDEINLFISEFNTKISKSIILRTLVLKDIKAVIERIENIINSVEKKIEESKIFIVNIEDIKKSDLVEK